MWLTRKMRRRQILKCCTGNKGTLFGKARTAACTAQGKRKVKQQETTRGNITGCSRGSPELPTLCCGIGVGLQRARNVALPLVDGAVFRLYSLSWLWCWSWSYMLLGCSCRRAAMGSCKGLGYSARGRRSRGGAVVLDLRRYGMGPGTFVWVYFITLLMNIHYLRTNIA